MKHNYPVFPQEDGFSTAPAGDSEASRIHAVVTRDRETIQRWAALRGAEPATGVETESGPSTISVNDGGGVMRFNFPGAAKFRPISWDEWFERFDADGLVFVYEEEPSDRAHAIWVAKGGGDGHALDDWLDAERELGVQSKALGQRYRIVKED